MPYGRYSKPPDHLKDKWYAEHSDELRNAERLWYRFCSPGLPRQYATWLNGFLTYGGCVTHWYDFNMPCKQTTSHFHELCVLNKNATLTPLFGASAVTIIVPSHIHVTIQSLGHISVFFMADFTYLGNLVPCYPDVLDRLAFNRNELMLEDRGICF